MKNNNFFYLGILAIILTGCGGENSTEGLDCQSLDTSNTIEQLNLSTMQGGDLDPKVWECTIKKLTDKESQQQWYSILLQRLNLTTMQGGDLDPKVWERIIKKLTDKESQQQWRGILKNQKLLNTLSN